MKGHEEGKLPFAQLAFPLVDEFIYSVAAAADMRKKLPILASQSV